MLFSLDHINRNRRLAQTDYKDNNALEFEWGEIEPHSRRYGEMGGQLDGLSLTEQSDFNN